MAGMMRKLPPISVRGPGGQLPRNRSLLIPLIVILVSFSGVSAGQLWSGVLAPARAADWTQSGAGGIPNRSTICATLTSTNTAADINTAIKNCPSGQVVFLSAGTYNLTTGIIFNNKSNVTLRGAGADQTFLIMTGANSCGGVTGDICIFNGDSNYNVQPENTANWTSGYGQGSTSITLNNTTNLHVGSLLILDQIDDSADNGNVFVANNPAINCINCNNPGRPGNNCSSGSTCRPQTQIVTVTAISGNTVSISPGLYMPNWRSNQSPGAWWSSVLPVSGDGVENLSIDSTGVTVGGGIVSFYNASKCWVKGIRSVMAHDSHVKFWQSANNTVRDSYFFGSQGHGGTSSQSYGTDDYLSSAELVENNIFQHIATPMQLEDGQGDVFGYNFSMDNFNGPDISWLLGTSSHHAPGNNYILWEANQGVETILDDFHGTADFITQFRNRTPGWQPAATNQTIALINQAWSRYTNAIGNVFGTSGYHTNYSSVAGDHSEGSVCNHSIYALGWGGNCGNWAPYPNCGMNGCPGPDTLVPTTIMRWGNYDTVNAAVRFVNGEVPSGLPLYGNPVPSRHALPPSFYLSGQPSWFGSTPFPPNGPDVTGGNISYVGGYANNIPAANCFGNSPVDTSYATVSTGVTASWSGGTASAIIGSNAGNVNPASSITITGMTPAEYNCQHCTVTATTPTTVSYSVANNPGGSGSGGTAYWPDLLSFNADSCYSGSQGGQPAPPTNLGAVVH
jgi:hypothetical protein